METWKPVAEKLGPYEVSSLGNVRRSDNREAKKTTPNGDGYHVVRLWNNGHATVAYVHQLVAEAFIGTRPEAHHVGWRNNERSDNRATNVEYIPVPERVRRAHELGSATHGATVWNAKLTDDDVRSIRERVASGVKAANICREYGMSRSTISLIVNRKKWVHVV